MPKASAVVFYSITFDGVMTLALYVMIISFLEAVVGKIITLAAYCSETRNSKTEEVLVAYYTKASKDIDTEAHERGTVVKSHLELHAKMMETMQMMIDDRSAAKVRAETSFSAGTAGKSDAGVSSSEDEITLVSPEDNVVATKQKESPSSSIRSAALTG